MYLFHVWLHTGHSLLVKHLVLWTAIGEKSIGFFTIGLSDAFLSDYLTDLKFHNTK